MCPKGLNAAENDCTGGAPEGAGGQGWFKVYSSGANNWKWSTNTSDNDAHQIFATFSTPGTYNILLSARSSSHAIDRMVLSHSGYSGNPQSLSLAESARVPGSIAGAADGSPYSVAVTVTDGCVPAKASTTNFTWNVSDAQSTGSMTINVTSQGRSDHNGTHSVAMYLLSDLTTPAHTYTPTSNASGQMSVAGFAPGTYKVVVKRAGYLQRVQEMTLTSGTQSATFDQLLGGDINGDNVINLPDLSLLSSGFGQSGQASDINGDGNTSLPDLSLLSANFSISGESLSNN